MADPPPSSPATLDASSHPPNTNSANNPTPQLDQPPSTTAAARPSLTANPNPNPAIPVLSPTPPAITSFPPPISSARPAFRPAPQFSPLMNFQNHSVPPPGVSSAPVMAPGSVPPPVIQYQVAPGQLPNPALRPFAPIPNGYAAVPGAAPPGLPRYLSPYPGIPRPAFHPRPPGAIGLLSCPLVPGMPGVRPVIPPIIRPAAIPSVTPAEKPQTTVYVGKIAPTVDNDFMLSLLHLCGSVKSWKRQDLTDGTPRGFGFCEFETAEGVLRALRLLGKLAIDGQELVLNVNQATRGYLEQYVEKRKENAKKVKETKVAGSENSAVDGKIELLSADDASKQSDSGEKENPDSSSFGIVTEEDQVADREASKKLTNMIEERLKNRPLPPPPPMPGMLDGSAKSSAEVACRSRDGDSDVDAKRNDGTEVRKDDETISNSRAASVHGRSDPSSPDRRHDRRSRERDKEQDMKREKEREIERLERETERERVRKEREQRRKIEEAEREYGRYLRDWEQREREREKQRQYEKEKEKERERKRKKEILYDEDEDEDEDSRKRWRKSALDEKRRKRLREKEEEDDLADRLKEEEEIAESKKAEEEKSQRQQYDALRFLSARAVYGGERIITDEESSGKNNDNAGEQDQFVNSSHDNQSSGVGTFQNGSLHESNMAISDGHQISAAPTKKLGFGLLGGGKKATAPSVFHEEEDAQKEKKMRPLVPIDYSSEELQAVQPSVSGAMPPNLVAAAEFAKRISTVDHKEEKIDTERERSRRSSDKSTRDKDRHNDDSSRTRESKERNMDRDRDRGHGIDKSKTMENQKFLDAKQLIDMIPKTKEELFSYQINWDVYDKHDLHERMRPWISKKITEFLGEEEKTLVDYIVSSTQEHVKASRMLEQLQTILDEEAEMFVLKMWRMLIFEVKKVETCLTLRPKS